MRWTKKHSKNAVAAKARLRMQRANAPIELPKLGKLAKLPKLRPTFKITIESHHGDKVSFSLHRMDKKFLTSDGMKSARDISRAIETLLRFAD